MNKLDIDGKLSKLLVEAQVSVRYSAWNGEMIAAILEALERAYDLGCVDGMDAERFERHMSKVHAA